MTTAIPLDRDTRPPRHALEGEGLQALRPPGEDRGPAAPAPAPAPPAHGSNEFPVRMERPVLGPVLRRAFEDRAATATSDADMDVTPPAAGMEAGAGAPDPLLEPVGATEGAGPCPLPGNVTDLERAFWAFHEENPAIYELFTTFMREVIDRGLERISADQVMHRIRWECDVVTRGGRGFKVNNNFVAYYARLWLHNNPHRRDMFRTRRVRTGERVLPRREGHRIREIAV